MEGWCEMLVKLSQIAIERAIDHIPNGNFRDKFKKWPPTPAGFSEVAMAFNPSKTKEKPKGQYGTCDFKDQTPQWMYDRSLDTFYKEDAARKAKLSPEDRQFEKDCAEYGKKHGVAALHNRIRNYYVPEVLIKKQQPRNPSEFFEKEPKDTAVTTPFNKRI